MKLIEILQVKKYTTDKHTTHKYVQDFYDDNFLKYKQSNLNFLEIGVWNGESMKLWSDYFINAKNIVGIDIFVRTPIEIVKNNLIKYNTVLHKMDTVNDSDDVFNQFSSLYQDGFDIIIDDGCHNPIYQVETFKRFSKLMNKDGLYIVEDIADNLEAEKILKDNIPDITIMKGSNNKDTFGYIYF